MKTEGTTTIVLSRDEALVLFDLLDGFTDPPALQILHPAHRRALWNLCSLIEKELVEAFQPDYNDRLEIAKKRLTAG